MRVTTAQAETHATKDAGEMALKLTEFEGTDNEEILQIFKPLWNLSQLALRHDWTNVDHAVSSRRKLCGN